MAFDTNTSLSAILWQNSTPAQAVQFAVSSCVLLHSAETFAELAEVLAREKFDRYLPLIPRKAALAIIKGKTVFVESRSHVRICRDPEDDKFLDLVLDGHADVLVTGDQDLLCLNPFHACRILNSTDFLKLIQRKV